MIRGEAYEFFVSLVESHWSGPSKPRSISAPILNDPTSGEMTLCRIRTQLGRIAYAYGEACCH